MASVAATMPTEEGLDWDALFTAQRERLATLAGLILRDPEDAADVVQRVFEKAYRRRDRLDPWLSPAGWLTRATCNEAISLQRHKRLFKWLPLGNQLPTLAEADMSIDHLVVDRAMRALDAKHRAVVVLFYHHGYTLAEIAALLQIPRGTVASRLHHARTTLAAKLQDAQDNDKRPA
jgi:RNA polymerase sigma-70 factor, ECF subfamily